ncbi:hypothetical protein QF022_001657 [Vogesella perlucida]|nr:hypothetical protein [Vogesella perlucida]
MPPFRQTPLGAGLQTNGCTLKKGSRNTALTQSR